MVDFLFVIIELFTLSPMVETLKAEICRSLCFSKRGGSLWTHISDGRERRPPTTVGLRELEWLAFRVLSKYPQCIVWFCHKACVWQTDWQNYDSQVRASIASSCGKNTLSNENNKNGTGQLMFRLHRLYVHGIPSWHCFKSKM